MLIQTISTLNEFFQFLNDVAGQKGNKVFRGVKCTDFNLIPGIGRCRSTGGNRITVDGEKAFLKLFRQNAFPYLKERYSDLELLALAQHHGLPTRLLDWTWNPLVASYFAVREECTDDSLIYVWYKSKQDGIWSKKSQGKLNPTFDPFTVEKVTLFLPNHLTPRIIAQAGIFTIHPAPNEVFETSEILKVLIKNDIRREIKKALKRMSIHEASMFPDLGGIASHVKWLRTNIY